MLKKSNAKKITCCVLFVLQVIASMLLFYFASGLLPGKYKVLLAVIFAIFAIVTGVLFFKGKKKWTLVVAIALSALVSISSFAGSYYIGKTISAFKEISSPNTSVSEVSVIVLAEFPYQSITDLKNKQIGVQKEDACSDETLQKIEKTITYETKTFENNIDMIKCLYEHNVDAIILRESLREIVEDIYEDFSEETRILSTEQIEEESKETEETVMVEIGEPFSVYISGIDKYGPVSSVSRSDVNMIVTVNPKTRKILMTSIPRDYHVVLHSFGAYDKLTHAGIYGVEESMNTLEDLFNIEIQYYARVNFTSLVEIIDAIGGIEVYSDQTFTPCNYPDMTIYEGTQHMDGEMALAFARERYAYKSGDNHRIQNQQEVLKGIVNRVISPSILRNYSSLMDIASSCMQTNVPYDTIENLVSSQIADMTGWEIEQISVTGTGSTSKSCYSMPGPALYVMDPDMESVEAAAKKISSFIAEN